MAAALEDPKTFDADGEIRKRVWRGELPGWRWGSIQEHEEYEFTLIWATMTPLAFVVAVVVAFLVAAD